MTQLIVDAITNRRLLSFRYHGRPRLIEPHLLGVTTAGNLALRAYQVGGSSGSGNVPDWRLFEVPEMRELQATSSSFEGTRPGYNRADTRMTRILARL